MIRIIPLTHAELDRFRDTRLRALKDTPEAFGSTYAFEAGKDEAWWRERLAKWTAPGKAAAFLALDGEAACGLAAVFTRAEHPGRAELVSMWVAPACRRSGAGRMLVQAVEGWCVDNGIFDLRLEVADGNEPAVAFYERLGFRLTGRRQPMPRDAAIWESEMAKDLSHPDG